MAAPILAPVSWDRMIRAVEKVRERLLRVARALERAGIAYAVVGGNAVAAWVSRVDEAAVRNTRDVDILLRRSDLAAARAALEAEGFVYRQVASLGCGGHLDLFLDGPDASARDAVHVVFASEKVSEDSLIPSPDVLEIEDGGSFRVIALESLVRMKLTAFRDKDRVHLRDLVEVGLIDEFWVEKFEPPLDQRLVQILESPGG
jgi:predicted nucleotidyltransferase